MDDTARVLNSEALVLFPVLQRRRPRKYGYAASFPNCSPRARARARKGESEECLNFYSCAGETAIFRSIKWALKLSGQFRRQDVLLFSSTANRRRGTLAPTAGEAPLLSSPLLSSLLIPGWSARRGHDERMTRRFRRYFANCILRRACVKDPKRILPTRAYR